MEGISPLPMQYASITRKCDVQGYKMVFTECDAMHKGHNDEAKPPVWRLWSLVLVHQKYNKSCFLPIAMDVEVLRQDLSEGALKINQKWKQNGHIIQSVVTHSLQILSLKNRGITEE